MDNWIPNAELARGITHSDTRGMAHATGTGWSLRRLRERVLRAGARLILSGRRMTLALSGCAFRDHPITGSDNIRSVIPI